jgi:hypothetical protein
MWLRKQIQNKAQGPMFTTQGVGKFVVPDTFLELDLELLLGRQTMTHLALALIPRSALNLVIAFFGQLQSYCLWHSLFKRLAPGLHLLLGMVWRV